MKSKITGSSEDKIEKVTESLWKIWWFSFYLIIVPSLIAVVGFFIYFFIGKDIYVSIGLSVITFVFALLFFYKAFDKYRNNPFFLNRKNNLSARIDIVFLITIFSLIVTPIFVFFTPGEYYFELLPLIAFIVLYNIVYYYFYFQPIDNYDFIEEKYEHETPFSQWLKQPYNIVILFNFIIHIVYLSYTFNTKISWLFPIVFNIIFYINTRLKTLKNVKSLSEPNKDNKKFLLELILYKKKYVNSFLGLMFILLIQMPFVITFTYIFMGIPHEIIEIISISILSLILLLFYFKTRLYISSFYDKILRRFELNGIE